MADQNQCIHRRIAALLACGLIISLLAVAEHCASVPPKDPRNSASPIKAWKFFPGDISRWENRSNVEFAAFHSWSSSRYQPKRVDAENHEIEFTDYPQYRMTRWFALHHPSYAENAIQEFGKPGEWYLDNIRFEVKK